MYLVFSNYIVDRKVMRLILLCNIMDAYNCIVSVQSHVCISLLLTKHVPFVQRVICKVLHNSSSYASIQCIPSDHPYIATGTTVFAALYNLIEVGSDPQRVKIKSVCSENSFLTVTGLKTTSTSPLKVLPPQFLTPQTTQVRYSIGMYIIDILQSLEVIHNVP